MRKALIICCGIGKGGFDLQSDDSAMEMTDRVLSMLYQYLVSNQALRLNETFQIYCKILSVEHSKFNETQTKTNRKKRKVANVHVGNSTRRYNFKWAIDVDLEDFIGKCLLTCTILSLLQHAFFESQGKNKLFLYASRIHSSIEQKKNMAKKIITQQLNELFSVTGLKQTGPYQLKSTIILLSETYHCQFFIFDCINRSSKLYLMYPKIYNDSLKPIFLFRPQFDSTHLLFIRNSSHFFSATNSMCLQCLKTFKRNRDSRSTHLCPKRPTCFACRRFFMSETTYVHSNLTKRFCDKFLIKDRPFSCPTCNCEIVSEHCLRGHKRFCKGKGYFGYKCNSCNRFTYCHSKMTSQDLKQKHSCDDLRICKNCYQKREPDHLCPLKIEKLLSFHTRLAFFEIIFDNITRKPLMAIILREEKERGIFEQYLFFDPETSCTNSQTANQ